MQSRNNKRPHPCCHIIIVGNAGICFITLIYWIIVTCAYKWQYTTCNIQYIYNWPWVRPAEHTQYYQLETNRTFNSPDVDCWVKKARRNVYQIEFTPQTNPDGSPIGWAFLISTVICITSLSFHLATREESCCTDTKKSCATNGYCTWLCCLGRLGCVCNCWHPSKWCECIRPQPVDRDPESDHESEREEGSNSDVELYVNTTEHSTSSQ